MQLKEAEISPKILPSVSTNRVRKSIMAPSESPMTHKSQKSPSKISIKQQLSKKSPKKLNLDLSDVKDAPSKTKNSVTFSKTRR